MILPNKEKLFKTIILNNFPNKKNLNIVDATCGNGHDTFFLANNFNKANIIAVDIQKEAINNSQLLCKEFENIQYIQSDHLNFFTNSKLTFDLIVFNTGFLPNGSTNICTTGKNTVNTLKQAIKKVNKKGLISITVYQGHDNGEEHRHVLNYLKTLNKYEFIVFTYQTINTINSPILYLIEKK